MRKGKIASLYNTNKTKKNHFDFMTSNRKIDANGYFWLNAEDLKNFNFFICTVKLIYIYIILLFKLPFIFFQFFIV